jgi:hypothetical protein
VKLQMNHLTSTFMDLPDMIIHLVSSAGGILTSMMYTLLFRPMYSFLVADKVRETAEAGGAARKITEDSWKCQLHVIWLLTATFLHRASLTTLSGCLGEGLFGCSERVIIIGLRHCRAFIYGDVSRNKSLGLII